MNIAMSQRRASVGWTAYAWLFYLVFFFAYPLMSHASRRQWALSVLAVLVFLPLYFRGFREHGRRLLVICWAIFAIGALITPVNPAGTCFFIYAVAFVGFAAHRRQAAVWVVILIAAMTLEAWWLGWPLVIWLPAFLVMSVVGGTNIHFAEMRRRGDELRVAKEAVEEMARIAERERIGRDLHDLLGHTLSVIVLKSELASRLAERDVPRAVAEIRDVERISRDALAEVRKAVRGYRSDGLLDEVANAERVLVAAGIRPAIDVAKLTFSADEDRALAFALREAVTNVVRHAGASHCWITLRARGGRAVLEVRDDGRGGMGPEGSGLSGMRERLRQVAGTVEREGGAGTRLQITLPTHGAPQGTPA
jgi:two-component system sensor histidine kinase DesK